MDLLKLIKERKTVRRYKNKPIPKKVLDKIIEAGIWGPAVLALGLQPWKFIVITNKELINKISQILLKKTPTIGVGGNKVLRISSATIANAPAVIVVYNTTCVSKALKHFKNIYIKLGRSAEASANAAAIQNMVLTADSLGIGSCWLDAPLFCEKKINKLLRVNESMSAMLALGYPVNKTKRSPRKPISETVRYIE